MRIEEGAKHFRTNQGHITQRALPPPATIRHLPPSYPNLPAHTPRARQFGNFPRNLGKSNPNPRQSLDRMARPQLGAREPVPDDRIPVFLGTDRRKRTRGRTADHLQHPPGFAPNDTRPARIWLEGRKTTPKDPRHARTFPDHQDFPRNPTAWDTNAHHGPRRGRTPKTHRSRRSDVQPPQTTMNQGDARESTNNRPHRTRK